jgi:hypothetical protein
MSEAELAGGAREGDTEPRAGQAEVSVGQRTNPAAVAGRRSPSLRWLGGREEGSQRQEC